LTPLGLEVGAAEAVEGEAVVVVDFPEKAQRVEADFRRREDHREVVRKAKILHPRVAVASKTGAASSTAKVVRTSKREAVTSKTGRVV
jgi:hypothetical protein